MNMDLYVVLGLLVAAVVMFAMNKPRMDAVALIMMVVLPFTGVVTMSETLSGFADPNVVLIGALFVIGEGLVRTGVAQRLGDWLVAKAGTSELRLLVLLMLVVAGLGAVMSSTGVVAIFIPIVVRMAQNTGISPSRLMMPLSFAALISGMMTLVATAPNLVVNAELLRHGSAGFGFFTFTPFGLPVLVLGIIYMSFARRLLAGNDTGTAKTAGRPSLRDWIDQYKLSDREYRVRVMDGSPLVGKTIGELNLRGTSGANILAIERTSRFSVDILRPLPKTELQSGDIILVDLFMPDLDVEDVRRRYRLEEMPLSGAYFIDRSQDLGMAEVMLTAGAELVGKTLIDCKFRTRYGLTVIGLRRGRTTFARGLLTEPLKVGDTLLLTGAWKDIRRLQANTENLLVLDLPTELDEVLPAASRAPQALACLALVIGLMVSGLVANVHAALIGCLLMGALRCIDLNSAYRSIHWQSLVLIVGMLPFSTALERTGGVELAANGLLALTGGASPHAVLACLFGVTALLGLFISNTATAVLMAPVALAIASDLRLSPYPFVMIVALAASTAFMTPVSSPVNTLIVGPGNYGFGDFVRVGAPFAVIVLIVSVFLVPLVLPP